MTAIPAAPAQDAPVPQVTDPVGDARWFTTAHARTVFVNGACYAAGDASATVCGQVPPAPDAGGVEAPPALDIVHARFEADAETLFVEIALASLDHDFVASGTDDEVLLYFACWTVGDADCRDGVSLLVTRVNGTVAFDASVQNLGPECEPVAGCWWGIETEIVPGTPGFIRMRVPRATLDPATVVLEAPRVIAAYALTPGGYRGTGYELRALDFQLNGISFPYAFGMTDTAGPGNAFALPPPARAFTPGRDSEPTRRDPAGDVPAADRPDLDILNMTYIEDERTVTVALEVSRVDEVPLDHHLYMTLQPTTGAAIVAGYTATGGARTPYSGICESACGPNPRTSLKKPVDIEAVPGAPGWINLTFARSDLGRPGYGDSMGWAYVALLLPEAIAQQGPPDSRAESMQIFLGDYVYTPPPWWFQLGEARVDPSESSDFHLEDPVGDTDSTDPLVTALAATKSLSAFDITSLTMDTLPEGELRVELGVEDLSSVSPPTGFTAVLYATAISTEQGTFMIGYYDDRDRREFFCAPDTAVLTKPERDPTEVIWQTIPGLLSVARDRGQGAGGGSAPGSLIFLAPYSCVLEEAGDVVEAEAIAAGTFLVQSTDAEGISVQPVDTLASEGAVTLAATQVAPPPWYAEPFGIENFWDITGIASAALLSLLGLLALRRKQGALRRYLHEIEHVLATHAHDARAREAALLDIQTRLKRDLLKSRITEAHYVIVERRLDQHLGKVRVQALADAFGDLPHRLLLTLQDAMRDGVMDPEDWRLFRTHLAGESHLTADARVGIERRVQAWVRTHAAEAPGA